ncbi:MAG: flagellar motor switch protein FliM, partial [Actinomycetota bacterium]|nr:flagellar motor switch protein FliM [Actinomycetota bacterium]
SVLASAAPGVEVYDFQRPTTLGREQMRSLTLAFENFARQWATQLTAMTHAIVHASVDSIEVERYGEYAEALPELTTMVLLKIDDLAARAVLQIAPDVALGWVGMMLGGNGSVPAPVRTFTQIESTIVRLIVDYVIEDLTYSLGDLLDGRIEVDTLQYNSQMAQATTAREFMLVTRFTVTIGDKSSPTSLAFPLDALTGHDALASAGTGPSEPTRVRVDAVPVSLSVQFEPAIVSPRDILGLAEGDVIRLPHPQHRPLNVTVEGHTVAEAAVGANGSRLACVIVKLEESL